MLFDRDTQRRNARFSGRALQLDAGRLKTTEMPRF